jgi:hypothetical protein
MTNQMTEGWRADSARRHQRVSKALTDAVKAGDPISVSAIARAAGVDRTFLYRHPDLLGQVHTAEATPPQVASGTAVTRASLQADLTNAQVSLRNVSPRAIDGIGAAQRGNCWCCDALWRLREDH